MANSNSFDLLSGYEIDDPSALIAVHLKAAKKSPNPAKKPLAPPQPAGVAPPNPPSRPFFRSCSVRSDDTEKNLLLERQFHRTFSLAEDGEFNRPPGCDGGGRDSGRRSRGGGGGVRRSYQSCSRFYCRPGRQYIDEEAEDYVVMVSSKYRIFDRHGLYGRGNLVKREGNGRWNWGSLEEEWLEENPLGTPNGLPSRAFIEQKAREKFFNDDENGLIEEDESEDEEMTLDEYEWLMEEKKKAFQAMFLVVPAKQNSDENFNEQGLENESAKRTDNMEELADGEKAFQAMFLVVPAEQNSDENFNEQGLENESAMRTDNMEDDFVIVDPAKEDCELLKRTASFQGDTPKL